MRTPRVINPSATLAVGLLLGAALPGAAIAQSPAAVPAAPSPAAVTGGWFDALSEGVCYELTLAEDDTVDFSVPPAVVDCAQPHGNQVAGTVPLGDGAVLPEGVDQLVMDGCAEVYSAFLGRPIEELSALVFPFTAWPDETDWAAGVREGVCTVAGNALVGSARGATLTAPGETLGAFWQESDSAEVFLLDAGTGEAVRPVTDGSTSELLGPPSWMPDGSALLFGAQLAEDDTDLFLAAADGSGATPLIVAPGRQEGGDISPDGTRIAYINNSAGGEYDIWVAPLDGTEGAPITDHPERDATPRWSPDGSAILFRRVTDGVSEIWLMGADGSDPRRIVDVGAPAYDPRWAPDGSSILFTTEAAGSMDIWIAEADGADPRQLTTEPSAEEYPTYSPDGRFIAFQSDGLGVPTLWIMNADGTEQSLLSALSPAGYATFAPVTLSE